MFASPPTLDDDSDEEDRRERQDHEIEQVVISFVDEPAIRHDEIPEFELDAEGEEFVFRNERRREDGNIKRGSGNLYQGQIFFNGISYKEVVLDHARNIKQYRYDKTKYYAMI